jgi:hypothetical protein
MGMVKLTRLEVIRVYASDPFALAHVRAPFWPAWNTSGNYHDVYAPARCIESACGVGCYLWTGIVREEMEKTQMGLA